MIMRVRYDCDLTEQTRVLKPSYFGNEYTVYAIEIWNGNPHYFIYDKEMSCNQYHSKSIPLLGIPFSHCTVIDNRISRYWVFSNCHVLRVSMWSFPEWAEGWVCVNEPDEYINDGFYGRLGDKNSKEVEIFFAYKEAMDIEFPINTIKEKGKIIDPDWLQCPFCYDAWNFNSASNAMVRCPYCKKIANNPQYKNVWPHLNTTFTGLSDQL